MYNFVRLCSALFVAPKITFRPANFASLWGLVLKSSIHPGFEGIKFSTFIVRCETITSSPTTTRTNMCSKYADPSKVRLCYTVLELRRKIRCSDVQLSKSVNAMSFESTWPTISNWGENLVKPYAMVHRGCIKEKPGGAVCFCIRNNFRLWSMYRNEDGIGSKIMCVNCIPAWVKNKTKMMDNAFFPFSYRYASVQLLINCIDLSEIGYSKRCMWHIHIQCVSCSFYTTTFSTRT